MVTMLTDHLTKGRRLILGSASPRRQELLRSLGLSFEVRVSNSDETHPEKVSPFSLPLSLAQKKAEALQKRLQADEILLTADTIVVLNGQVLEKPQSKEEAKRFLQQLSGKWHQVITGYLLSTQKKQEGNTIITEVHFCDLTTEEIDFYVDQFSPLDKAGAYGIQEWIGYACIDEIRGSFNNVVGLPTSALYASLKHFE